MTRGVAPRVGRPTRAEAAAREGPQGRVIRALGHRIRRKIVLLLEDGEKPVHELADHFPVSRPMVSKHLRVLVEGGLVEGRKVGREWLYQLTGGDATRTAIARADHRHADAMRRLRDHLQGAGE